MATGPVRMKGPPAVARRFAGTTAGWLALSSLLVLAAAVLYLAGRPLSTNDFWWHLKLGEIYATQGFDLAADPISHAAPPGAPAPHQWLFGVSLYGAQRVVGLGGLRAVHALAVAGILALAFSIFRRESRSVPAACLATAAFAVLSSWRLLQLRPDLVSIAAALALYRLLLETGRAPSWQRIALAVVLLVVWANCHTLFAIGPALLVAALLGCGARELLVRYARARRATTDVESADLFARRLGAALLLVLVATLLNPRGAEQHLTFFTSAESTALWVVHDEWAPFDPLDPDQYGPAMNGLTFATADALLAAFALAALVAGVRFLRAPSEATARALDPVLFGLGLAAIVATGVAVRFLWLSFFPLLYLLRVQRLSLPGEPAGAWRSWCCATATAAIAAAYPYWGGFREMAITVPRQWAAYLATPYDTTRYFVQGVAFLAEAGLQGNLFNAYKMGGFLAWRLGPELQTFVDGRMNFTDEVLRDYKMATLQRGARPGETFLDILARHDIDVFFGVGVPTGPRNTEMTLYTTANLERAPGWKLVSRSLTHAIYVRDNERNRENLARVAAYYERADVPFDPARGLDVARVIRERPGWAVAHELVQPHFAAQLAGMRSPKLAERAGALEGLGLTYALNGAYREQLELDRVSALMRPEAKAPRERLVYALLRLERPEEALAVARELVALDPDDARSQRFEQIARSYLAEHRASERDGRKREIPLDAAINLLPLIGE